MATTADGEVMLQLLQEFRDFRLETRSSFQGLERRMDALEGRISTLEKLFESLDRRVSLLDQRVGALEDLFDSLNQRVNSLDQRVGSLEMLFGSLDQRVGLIEVMVTNLHVTNQRFVGYIKRVGKMMIQVATDREDLDARVDNIERRMILLEK
jgi:chromosome segregation ATPase